MAQSIELYRIQSFDWEKEEDDIYSPLSIQYVQQCYLIAIRLIRIIEFQSFEYV